MRAKVEETIEVIRPALQADGGDIVLRDVNETTGVVSVTLTGACGTCPTSTQTLKAGIERIMRDRIDGVTEAGGEVSYLDLELDLWVTDGVPRWEDEEDVEAARAAGLLDAADLARIERTRDFLTRRHRVVIAEVRALLASLGIRA
mgnify:CR=1 FL=1